MGEKGSKGGGAEESEEGEDKKGSGKEEGAEGEEKD